MKAHLIDQTLFCSVTEHSWLQYALQDSSKSPLTAETYCRILFGQHNFELFKLLKTSFAIGSNRIYSAHYQSFDLCIHALDGSLIERKINFFEGYTPYEIAWNEAENEIWAATGSGQVVLSKKLSSEKVDIQIGTPYDDLSELNYPESGFIFNEDIFIAEMGNQRILKMNLKSKERTVYRTFSEHVWDFQKSAFTEIVSLDSGIYALTNGQFVKLER